MTNMASPAPLMPAGSSTPPGVAARDRDAIFQGAHLLAEAGPAPPDDPIGVEGGINLYAYVGNDPVNFTDSLGHDPLSANNVTASPLPVRP